MYKPPLNSNRVKSIKSRFENLEDNKQQESGKVKNGTRNNLNVLNKNNELKSDDISTKHLSRQLSDPSKRNIKRTPAFRVDKSLDKAAGFARNNIYNRSSHFDSKVKQFNSAVKNNCDNNSNFINNVDRSKNISNLHKSTVSNKVPVLSEVKTKPLLLKSKSSHDFAYIRSKFDKTNIPNGTVKNAQLNGDKTSVENQKPVKVKDNNDVEEQDLSLLYTEPIPKSLRNKNCDNLLENEEDVTLDYENITLGHDIHHTSTLKLDLKSQEIVPDAKANLNIGLTDTLKTALKRPLPSGPPPKKPPRTFLHATSPDINRFEKNISFLHLSKTLDDKINIKDRPITPKKKHDPKYMLTKLENALRNNKLRSRKQPKVDISTTSGEDSDDSLLFKSKSNRSLPKPPSEDLPASNFYDTSPVSSNFNCLNGLGCSASPYEKLKEPSSSFFISSESEEPIYAEPFHFKCRVHEKSDVNGSNCVGRNPTNRNSLYYMSSPVMGGDEKNEKSSDEYPSKQDLDLAIAPALCKIVDAVNKQISAESSSLSSFTSDLESTPSPMEDGPGKIKQLKSFFETVPNSEPQYGVIDSQTRVDNLKQSLKNTLDHSFLRDDVVNGFSPSNDPEGQSVQDIITKFQTYIKCMPKYAKPQACKDTLFYCCMIIEKVKDVVQIKYKFPPHVEIPPNIEHMCFPESENFYVDCTNSTQSYSLLITNDKGERTYGYCRRVLPEGCTSCLPLAYCILSKYRAHRFYKKVLMELESRHGNPNKYRDELIKAFYKNKFPKHGESIKINLTRIESYLTKTDKENITIASSKPELEESLDLKSYVHIDTSRTYGTISKYRNPPKEKIYVCEEDFDNCCISPSYILENEEKVELILTLHPDSRFEDGDLKMLHRLPENILLKIFSSLLLERKVILICSDMSMLSSCVDALQSILYPFSWVHTFIPILPESIWDIVESPTPVICGVLSPDVVLEHAIENGIVVNLDTSRILKEEGDENKILSSCMQKVWRKSMQVANKAAASKEYVHSVYLSDSYLQVFVLCFKNYKSYFVDGNFQTETFIKNAKTKGIKRFLKMFTETHMFMAFIDSYLSDPNSFVTFDRKIEIYGSDDSNFLLDKLLEWNKLVINLGEARSTYRYI